MSGGLIALTSVQRGYETTAGTAGTMTVGQIKVTPHTLGAYTDISRQNNKAPLSKYIKLNGKSRAKAA